MKSARYLIVVVLMVGCAGRDPLYLMNDYDNKKPTTIAVMPIQDMRQENRGEDIEDIEEAVEDVLESLDYNIITAEVVRSKLQNTSNLKSKPELARLIGADALFETEVVKYDVTYAVVYRSWNVEMNLTLFDGDSGQEMWRDRAEYDDFTAGLLSAAISAFEPLVGLQQTVASLPEAD